MGQEGVAPGKRVDEGAERAQGQAWAPPVFKCQVEKLLAKEKKHPARGGRWRGCDRREARRRRCFKKKDVAAVLIPGEGEQSVPGRGNRV